MPIIKNGAIVEDAVRHLADDEAPASPAFTVSLNRWQAEKAALLATGAAVGVRVAGGDDLSVLAADLPKLALVTVEFPALADGRAFSLARLLRQRYGYTGEIRAHGDFIRDQVYFLQRVGVNALEPTGGGDLASLLTAFADFSHDYQQAADGKPSILKQRYS